MQDGIFAQVVLDEGGDVGVDGLVVGDAVADGVGESDVPGAIGAHEAGHAEHGIGAESRADRGSRRRRGDR